jgi:hypothetical protein
MRGLKFVALMALAVLLVGCSKTVQWEEEVPLNTGEVIWVKRSVVYVRKGAGGNPFDVDYRPEWNEVIQFEWRGKKYAYEGVADVFVLAISPLSQPVLIARASDKDWENVHKHPCSTPSYVQLMPNESGRVWSWPKSIEPWLFGLPANLMRHRGEITSMRKSYTAQDRAHEDAMSWGQSPSTASIDSKFFYHNHCKFYKS